MIRGMIQLPQSTSICYLKHFFISIVLIITLSNTCDSQDKSIAKIDQVFSLIEQFYKDSVDMSPLVETAIRSALNELDPHTSYFTREEFETMNESLKGNFEGIGISYQTIDDSVLIVAVMEGSPAEKAGLFPGDFILSADGTPISGQKDAEESVRRLIGGKKGTLVELLIKKPEQVEPVKFLIERDKIPVKSVETVYKTNDLTGYIRLTRFSATTGVELKKAFKELNKGEDCKSIILDLRGNGGGYLDKAVEVADEFLSDDKTIVYTQGRNNPRKNYRATSKGDFEVGNLYVLVDERSASASEIVAGALQDWDRGMIIGRRTFGKGLVQRQFMLNDSSAIRLTIAAYFTPTGRCIQKPYSDGNEEYIDEIFNREKNGELLALDSSKMVDSLMYKTLVNQRKVYGGGGIFPDIFIPTDTTGTAIIIRKMSRTGVFSRAAVSYYSIRFKKLENQYPTEEEFIRHYLPDEEAIQQLLKYVPMEDRGIVFSGNEQLRTEFKQLYTAHLGKLLFGTSSFFRIINAMDPAYLKAISLSEGKQTTTLQ